MSRRAQLFDISMILIVIGAMVGILLVMNKVTVNTSLWPTIGQRAFEIQNSYVQADYFVNYMSSSARWSSAQAINLIGDKGGFITLPYGDSDNFAFWNQATNPDAISTPPVYDSYYNKLNELMKRYIELYGKQRTIIVAEKEFNVYAKPFDSPYEFTLIDGKLLGIATTPLYVSMIAPSEKILADVPGDFTGLWAQVYSKTYPSYITGTYIFRPNFEINVNYNFEVYSFLSDAARKIVVECPAEPDVKACANARITKALDSAGETMRTITIDSKNNILYFTISQDGRKTVYLNDNAPEIKFALALP